MLELSSVAAFMLQILPFVNIPLAAIIIFSERRNPAVTWAWLMVLFLIPYFGFILYMIGGLEGRKYRIFANKHKQNQKALADIKKLNLSGLDFMTEDFKDKSMSAFKKMPNTSHIKDLLQLNFAGGAYLTQNNNVDIFADGQSKFTRLLDDIQNAKSFIHIQYYIFRNDNLGQKIVNALTQKAVQGVEVCLLLDGMGNFKTPKSIFKPLINAGGHLGIFLRPHFFRINFQNHRKLCVIDGHIGYVGGFNIGDEYMGHVKRFGNWRDMHIRIQGDAAKEMGLHFLLDWNFISHKHKIVAGDKYFPVINIPPKNPKANKSGKTHKGHKTQSKENCLMQILTSGPDTKWANIYNSIAKMIYEANHCIYMITPYFAPDDNIFESLKIAALSGADVRIIIPANPDHPFVKWCSLSYLGELLKAGVKCYEYTKGFIHSKMLIVDNIATSVGTTNMDIRSFKLNFEINAFIYDEKLSDQFKEQFYKDLKDSRQITIEDYQKRGPLQKIKEAVSRLLAPIL